MKLGFALARLVVLGAMLAGATASARAQSAELCEPIRQQLLFPDLKGMQQRALASDLLFGEVDTILCLVEILNGLKERVQSVQLDNETGDQLLRISGAIRSVLSTRGPSAIREFRRHDDPATASVLAFAARSPDPGLRINATLVLADVIDNSTVCVPIDHLYDPALLTSAGGESGRINLMGVVSVVAPWAYKENYANISRLTTKLRRDIGARGRAPQTEEVLTNLENRLAFQSKASKDPNMFRDLPGDERACAAYVPIWANADGRNLVY